MEPEAEAKKGFSIRSGRLGTSGCVKETTKKRKPLSDLTNLVNPNSKPSKLVRKPSDLASKILDSPHISSDSSIASSNFNITTRKTIYQSSKSTPGNGKNFGLPLNLHSQKKNKIDGRTFDPDSVALRNPAMDRTKDKGKAVIVPYVEKTKDKGKAVIVPHVEKTNDKGKAAIAPHVEKTKDKGKASISPHAEKTKDIGKTAIAPHVEKTKDKGKAAIASHVEMTKDKGKATHVAVDVFKEDKTRAKAEVIAKYASNIAELKVKGKGTDTSLFSGGISLKSVKDKGKESNSTTSLSSLAKIKDKGKLVVTPEDFPTAEKKRENVKRGPVPFSCPPLPKTRHIGNGLNESRDTGQSEFHTDPHMMHKQKRRRLPRDQDFPEYDLPADFIEKQKAYFKEVDEFELLEEEASDNDN